MEATLKFFRLFVLLAIMAGCVHEKNTSVIKQETDTLAGTSEPVSQDYKKPVELSFLKQAKKSILNDVFKPVGWSKDGKFAFVVEYADEACGCYSMRLTIIDAKRNKELWAVEFNDEGDKKDLAYFWSDKYDSIKTIFNKYGIIQSANNFKLEGNLFELDGKQFALNVRTTTSKEPDFGIDVVDEAEILVKSDTRDVKVADCPISKPSRLMSVMTAGFVKSPYENVIAIVYNTERIGYEGPPHVITVNAIGFDLAKL